ncbi:AraC family transcriptional regulator [Pedobacter yulinensis]|uniref:AraC family transcriptional regulator n=1 Tax=Pedobacter yulinensis TaxID=2126353 RepID=A0A2T3HMK1_9SPHI|nr:AraC family transcriptional regulator [Pedobacter yulinensis]PST83633.1 AraC family transcriptional regulator [Pedobacter yulinensis]
MINFYKYLPVSKEDESWGLTVLNVGCMNVGATEPYPLKGHPANYHFDWSSWRTLQEYQVIYITRGSGVFESASCKQVAIQAGTVIVLFPNEPHRYKPDPFTGWDEYWVGIKGNIIDNLVAARQLSPNKPTLYVGFNETVIDLYECIMEKTRHEQPGYQPQVSGAAFYLLGTCHSLLRQNEAVKEDSQQIIRRAMLLFRSNISNTFSAEQAAAALNIGYSSFRKLFKSHTGLSPGQYYLQLKIQKAKELLSNSRMSVKEIALDLNFESAFYFSKLFKEKTGLNPTAYRENCR